MDALQALQLSPTKCTSARQPLEAVAPQDPCLSLHAGQGSPLSIFHKPQLSPPKSSSVPRANIHKQMSPAPSIQKASAIYWRNWGCRLGNEQIRCRELPVCWVLHSLSSCTRCLWFSKHRRSITVMVATQSDLRGVPGCHISCRGPLVVPTVAYAIQTQSTSKRRTMQTIGSLTQDHGEDGVNLLL